MPETHAYTVTDTQDNNMSLLFVLHLLCSVMVMEEVSKKHHCNYKQRQSNIRPIVSFKLWLLELRPVLEDCGYSSCSSCFS